MANFVSVIITGNAKPLQNALAKATIGMSGFQKKVALGFVAAGAAATAFAVSAVKAAAKDQVAMAGLERQLKASTAATEDQIHAAEKFLKTAGRTAAFSKSALIPGFESLVVATHDVSKAQDIMSVAMDTARARNLDLTSVSEALAKAYAGNTRGLRNLSPELKKLIKDGATFGDVIKVLTENFGGAGAEYAKTFQGRLDILGNSMSALKKEIGYALLPIMEKLIPVFQSAADGLRKHPGIMTAVSVAVGSLAVAFTVATAAALAWKVAAATAVLVNEALATSFTTLQAAMGIVTAAVAIAVSAYALFSNSTDKSTKASLNLTDALYKQGDAQRDAIKAAIAANPAFSKFVELATMLGYSQKDLATFLREGKGRLDEYGNTLQSAAAIGLDAAESTQFLGKSFITAARVMGLNKKSLEELVSVYMQLTKGTDAYQKQLKIFKMLGLEDTSKAADTAKTKFDAIKSSIDKAKESIRSYVAGIRDSISGSVSLSTALADADNAEKDRQEAITNALEARKTAYEQLGQARAANDAIAYGRALQDIADAEKAVTTAQDIKPKNYTQIFREQIQAAKNFAGLLQQLIAPPFKLGKAGVQQLLDLGPVAGAQVASDLLSGAAGITTSEINQSLKAVARAGTAAGMATPGVVGALTAQPGSGGNYYSIEVKAGVGDKQEIAKEIVKVLQEYEKRLGTIPIKTR